MPRKPMPGPTVLRMEYMSNGKEVRDKYFIDDLTGERVTIPEDDNPTPVERIMSSEGYQRARSQQRIVRTQNVLIDAGMGHKVGYKPPQVEQIPAGKIKIAELNGQAVLVDKPSWRRL